MGIEEKQWDEVVLAAIDVFAVELQKVEIAQKFVEKLVGKPIDWCFWEQCAFFHMIFAVFNHLAIGPKSIIRGNALCGNLKTAYIGAARLDSIDDIHMVQSCRIDFFFLIFFFTRFERWLKMLIIVLLLVCAKSIWCNKQTRKAAITLRQCRK